MAAVSDGSEKPLEDCIDYDLQKHLKGLNTATPDLSTLAQKGDEKVRRDRHTLSLFCKFKRMSGVNRVRCGIAENWFYLFSIFFRTRY